VKPVTASRGIHATDVTDFSIRKANLTGCSAARSRDRCRC
jgi:hypothetical protein